MLSVRILVNRRFLLVTFLGESQVTCGLSIACVVQRSIVHSLVSGSFTHVVTFVSFMLLPGRMVSYAYTTLVCSTVHGRRAVFSFGTL